MESAEKRLSSEEQRPSRQSSSAVVCAIAMLWCEQQQSGQQSSSGSAVDKLPVEEQNREWQTSGVQDLAAEEEKCSDFTTSTLPSTTARITTILTALTQPIQLQPTTTFQTSTQLQGRYASLHETTSNHFHGAATSVNAPFQLFFHFSLTHSPT
eukprot:3380817-Amphidinium_carterae.1